MQPNEVKARHDTWISVMGAMHSHADDLVDVKEAGDDVIHNYDGLDDEETFPLLPWCDSTDDEFGSRWVDYSDRGPADVVLSGPVIGGWGPGRWHKNRRVAYWRLVDKFGPDRVKQMRQSQGRWSFLIKNLKAV